MRWESAWDVVGKRTGTAEKSCGDVCACGRIKRRAMRPGKCGEAIIWAGMCKKHCGNGAGMYCRMRRQCGKASNHKKGFFWKKSRFMEA